MNLERSIRIQKKGPIYFVFTRGILGFGVLMGTMATLQKMRYGPYEFGEIPQGFFLPMVCWNFGTGIILGYLMWKMFNARIRNEIALNNLEDQAIANSEDRSKRPQQAEPPTPRP